MENRLKSCRGVGNKENCRTMTEQTLDEETKKWVKEMLRIAAEDREILDALKNDKV